MDELGELLELLYGARRRFTTARGVLLDRSSTRLTLEAIKREQARQPRRRGGGSVQVQLMYATRPDDGPEPPDVHEERTRFWWVPPNRLREEVESEGPHAAGTTVIDGDLWWTYSPDFGAKSNVGLADDEQVHYGGGERFKVLLDPSGFGGALEFDEVKADGAVLRVRARPRDDFDHIHGRFHLHLVTGADSYELVVDRGRGIVLRLASYLDEEELAVTELEEIVFDEDFPEDTFVFVPPPGEEILPPEPVRRNAYTLEEAAAAAPFRVFAVPELPEGQWRLNVHFHEPRQRPPIPALATLFYHRADGRQTLVVSQGSAGEGGPSWPGIEPRLEQVERDGVGYTVAHGDRERGEQSAVAFEREGTAIQLQSSELDVEVMLELATSLEPVG
jgi:outer membrane lipoprotein-sorting protein